MKKLLFIVNPNAGQRRINRYLSDIVAIFNQAGYHVEMFVTTAAGDATRVVAQRAMDQDLIVCAGGDGTFNETVNGLLRSHYRIPLGYIPCGSTNDFGASLKLSTNILQAARNIVNGTPTKYDVGRFNDRHFTYVASFGAFTRTSYSTPQNVKNALGHIAYLLEGIQELSQLRMEHIRLEADGKTVEGDFLFGAISNSTSVGGILTLREDQVDMGDGEFEILLVRAPKNLPELTACIQAVQSQRYNCSAITFFSAKEVRVTADPKMNWSLDGEKEPGREKIRVVNLHQAITLIK